MISIGSYLMLRIFFIRTFYLLFLSFFFSFSAFNDISHQLSKLLSSIYLFPVSSSFSSLPPLGMRIVSAALFNNCPLQGDNRSSVMLLLTSLWRYSISSFGCNSCCMWCSRSPFKLLYLFFVIFNRLFVCLPSRLFARLIVY